MKSNHLATLVVYLFFIGIMTFGLIYMPKKGHPIALYIPMGIFIFLFFHKLFTWSARKNADGSFSIARGIGKKRQRIRPEDITDIGVSFDRSFDFEKGPEKETIVLRIYAPQQNFRLSSADFTDFDSVVEQALEGREDLLQAYYEKLKAAKKKEKRLHRVVNKLWFAAMVVLVLIVVLSYAIYRK